MKYLSFLVVCIIMQNASALPTVWNRINVSAANEWILISEELPEVLHKNFGMWKPLLLAKRTEDSEIFWSLSSFQRKETMITGYLYLRSSGGTGYRFKLEDSSEGPDGEVAVECIAANGTLSIQVLAGGLLPVRRYVISSYPDLESIETKHPPSRLVPNWRWDQYIDFVNPDPTDADYIMNFIGIPPIVPPRSLIEQ